MKNCKRCLILIASYAALVTAAAAILFLGGCKDENNNLYADRTPPRAPRGVYSVTGDHQVDIYWSENCELDLEGYRVYWSENAVGPYKYVATTSETHYTDTDVTNGHTYYYAVTAFDRDGNESDLSYETVFDTPRPEGFDLVLYDFAGPNSVLSGYVFSTETRQLYSLDVSPAADIYYGYVSGEYVMFAWNPSQALPLTQIQDAGYRPLVELNYAPTAGWSETGWVTLTPGHSYYVQTRDDHYAKFYVTDVRPQYVVIDWAYQVDQGNPELVIQKLAKSGGAGLTAGTPSESAKQGGDGK